jgi:hypothetical protein
VFAERDMLNVLIQVGLINDGRSCEKCYEFISFVQFSSNRLPFGRCTKRGCSRKKMPLFTNSVFDGIKISIKFLELLYNFSCRRPVSDSVETLNLNKNTVMAFYGVFKSCICFFRQLPK